MSVSEVARSDLEVSDHQCAVPAQTNTDSSSLSDVPEASASRHFTLCNLLRTSSCCLALTVFCVLTMVGVFTYLSVWDGQEFESVKNWIQHVFASEKKLLEGLGNGSTIVEYDAGDWIYFALLAVVFIMNLTVVVPALVVVLRRRCRSTASKVEAFRNLDEKLSVDAIVPCYLPNEKDIIEETLWHILQNVEFPGDFKLWLVYNTPEDMPDIEARLHAMSRRVDLPHGRKVSVVLAEDSKSKAENINLVLPRLTAKYTVIYDADHHPDPESLMLLVEKLRRRNLACAQGSTYIRDLKSGILARIIDAEFFVTHFIYFPCTRLLTRNAVFCGSNGLWKTEVLQSTTFNPAMQTEDIDVSVRMLLEQHCIDFCPESRSGELAPVNIRALLKQRLRWAIGWDQVSLQLWNKIFKAGAREGRKVAVAYVCWSRWWMQAVALIAGIVTPILSFVQRCDPEFVHAGMGSQLLQTCMFYFYLTLLVASMVEAISQAHHRGVQSWIQVIFVILLVAATCFYIIFQACLIAVSLFRIGTGTVGGWVVTARSAQRSKVPPEDIDVVDEEKDDGSVATQSTSVGSPVEDDELSDMKVDAGDNHVEPKLELSCAEDSSLGSLVSLPAISVASRT